MRRKARSSVKAIFLLCSVSHVNPKSLDGLEVTSAPGARCKLTHAFSTREQLVGIALYWVPARS